MHQRIVVCRICRRQYFPASLRFHVKVCAAKEEHVELRCDHCGESLPCALWKAHMEMCERVKGRSSRTACGSSLERKQATSMKDGADIRDDGEGESGVGDVRVGRAGEDGRVACCNCDRKFNADRVQLHQQICMRVNQARKRGNI